MEEERLVGKINRRDLALIFARASEVGGVAGVSDVAVDLATKLVTVTGAALDRDAIVAAIDEAGYDVA